MLEKRSLAIKERVFLVGCSRSGTTLLQTLLSSHSKIHSFPETGFFIKSVHRRCQLTALFGFATGREYQALQTFLRKIDREDLAGHVSKQSLFFQTSVNSFISILDYLTLEEGKDIWIEKSPKHFYYTNLIKKYVPDAYFIFIVRDGRDVVASIYDRSLKFPEYFGNRKQSLNYGIQLWNNALEMAFKYVNKPDYTIVSYEHLIEKPDVTLRWICNDIGVEYEPQMVKMTEVAAQKVILPHQKWVMGAMESPRPKLSKFELLFDQETRCWISNSLKLKKFEELKQFLYNVSQLDEVQP